MAYLPIPRPAGLPPQVSAVVDHLEDSYLRDVHVMLRLPIPHYGLKSTCAFSCAQVLMSLVGGVSTLLYAHRSNEPGADFQRLLVDFFPWSDEPKSSLTPHHAARILYELFRNPLAHNLGEHIKKKPATPQVKLKRGQRRSLPGGLTERAIERLEKEPRPRNMDPAIAIRPGDATVLYIEALYWGSRVMLARLLIDSERMASAEAYLAKER